MLGILRQGLLARLVLLVRAEHEGRTWSIVLDLGNGALGAKRHIQPYAVDAVLLSHLHVDHCMDVCGLYVMMRYVPGGPSQATMPCGTPGPACTSRAAYGSGEAEDVLGVLFPQPPAPPRP